MARRYNLARGVAVITSNWLRVYRPSAVTLSLLFSITPFKRGSFIEIDGRCVSGGSRKRELFISLPGTWDGLPGYVYLVDTLEMEFLGSLFWEHTMLFQMSRVVRDMLANPFSVSPALPEVEEEVTGAIVFGRLKEIPTAKRVVIVRGDDPFMASYMLQKTGMITIMEARSTPPYVIQFLQQRYPGRFLVIDRSVAQQYDGTYPTIDDAVRRLRKSGHHMSIHFAHVHPMDVATGDALDVYLDQTTEWLDPFGHLLLHLPHVGVEKGNRTISPSQLISQRLSERLLFMRTESSSTPDSLGSSFVSDTAEAEDIGNPFREDVLFVLGEILGDANLRTATKAEDFLTPLLDRGPKKATLFSYRVPILN